MGKPAPKDADTAKTPSEKAIFPEQGEAQ
jgi:hypothetical protein